MVKKSSQFSIEDFIPSEETIAGMHTPAGENMFAVQNRADDSGDEEDEIKKEALGLTSVPQSTNGGELLDLPGSPQNPGMSMEKGDDEETEFFGAKEEGVDFHPEHKKEQQSNNLYNNDKPDEEFFDFLFTNKKKESDLSFNNEVSMFKHLKNLENSLKKISAVSSNYSILKKISQENLEVVKGRYEVAVKDFEMKKEILFDLVKKKIFTNTKSRNFNFHMDSAVASFMQDLKNAKTKEDFKHSGASFRRKIAQDIKSDLSRVQLNNVNIEAEYGQMLDDLEEAFIELWYSYFKYKDVLKSGSSSVDLGEDPGTSSVQQTSNESQVSNESGVDTLNRLSQETSEIQTKMEERVDTIDPNSSSQKPAAPSAKTDAGWDRYKRLTDEKNDPGTGQAVQDAWNEWLKSNEGYDESFDSWVRWYKKNKPADRHLSPGEVINLLGGRGSTSKPAQKAPQAPNKDKSNAPEQDAAKQSKPPIKEAMYRLFTDVYFDRLRLIDADSGEERKDLKTKVKRKIRRAKRRLKDLGNFRLRIMFLVEEILDSGNARNLIDAYNSEGSSIQTGVENLTRFDTIAITTLAGINLMDTNVRRKKRRNRNEKEDKEAMRSIDFRMQELIKMSKM